MDESTEHWRIDAARLRRHNPQGILFLCVANSARSQIAEGIARSLAPPGTMIWSAGSRPASVRPEAVAVLAELGIDISSHQSKGIAEIPADRVDTVVTLCREQVCPVFPGQVLHIHWALPDPAATQGNDEARLEAFRKTRDELMLRLGAAMNQAGR